MRRILILFPLLICTVIALAGKEFTSEVLYSHPFIVGNPPADPTWSPDGKILAFLWNEAGNRFRDLYIADLSGKMTRLTDLAGLPRDEQPETPSEFDRLEEEILDSGLSGPLWSKDGKTIFFRYRGDIFTIAVKPGSTPVRLMQTDQGESNVSFSEDGRWLAYTAGNDIYVREMTTGRIAQLTRDGSDDIRNGTGAYDTYLSGVFWAPDSRKLAFVQHDITGFDRQLIPDYTTEEVTTSKQQREIAGGRLPAIKLGIVYPDSAHKLPIWMDLPEGEQYYLRCIDWSPDSRKILFEVMPRLMFDRYILLADVETGAVDTLWHESDDRWIPRNMAKVQFGPGGNDVIFASEISGWCHLYSIPVEGAQGIARALTAGEWEIPSGGWGRSNDWQLSQDRSKLLFISSEDHPAERHLYRIDLPQGTKTRLTAEPGWIRTLTIADDGSKAALIYGDLETPFDLYWCQTKAEQPIKRITHSPPPAFNEYDWFQPQYISIPTSDGQSMPAKLWLPVDAPTPAPLIVYVHGAGYHQNVDKAPWGYEDRFHRMLAQKGFAIVDIDFRGSSGYGRDWRVGIFRHTGGRELDDAVDAVDYCVKQGWARPGATGIWGWSYGGFLTNMAMFKRPDVFKVGCSVAAVNNWLNYNLEYTSQRWKDPQDDPEGYEQSAPITFAEGLEGKLLIIHGMQDSNVHVQDTIQLIDKLIGLGKDFDLLLYPRENHGFTRDESDVHVMRSMMNYFIEHLK